MTSDGKFEAGAYAYMLRCADKSYYVGSTRLSLDHRLDQHNAGTYEGYTKTRLPVELVWHQHFVNITDAIAVERQIKGGSREKKEALIRGDYDSLRILAARGQRAIDRRMSSVSLPSPARRRIFGPPRFGATLRDGRRAASSG